MSVLLLCQKSFQSLVTKEKKLKQNKVINRKGKMVQFKLSDKIKKDVWLSCQKHGTKKRRETELQTFIFQVKMYNDKTLSYQTTLILEQLLSIVIVTINYLAKFDTILRNTIPLYQQLYFQSYCI